MGVLSDDDDLDYESDEQLPPPPSSAPRRQPHRPNVQAGECSLRYFSEVLLIRNEWVY